MALARPEDMMQAFLTFSPSPFLNTLVSYLAAFVFGTAIGAERQYRQRTAGLRTNTLVALASAAFVDLGARLGGSVESIRVIAYVVSGIGFLGAGVIMKEGMNVRGLNTAATLWCSAAVGAIAGSDMLAEAALLTFCVIAANTLLRPLVEAINRIPTAGRAIEASYSVSIIVEDRDAGPLADTLVDCLENAGLLIAEVSSVERSGHVTVSAELANSHVSDDELAQIIGELEQTKGIVHATWQARTRD
jgi:putative Mg2+ transporter-C (MgtC) family protein